MKASSRIAVPWTGTWATELFAVVHGGNCSCHGLTRLRRLACAVPCRAQRRVTRKRTVNKVSIWPEAAARGCHSQPGVGKGTALSATHRQEVFEHFAPPFFELY